MKRSNLIFKKTQISDSLFFLSYGIYLLVTLLGISFYAIYINPYVKVLIILCVLIIIFKEILCEKIHFKEILYLLICGVLSLIMLIHSVNATLFPIFFFLYGARKIEFKRIAKFTIIESFGLFIFIVVSAKLGIILNYTSISAYRTRTYLGFRYSLYSQMLLFNITALDLYINNNKKRKSIFRYLFWVIINYWLFSYTDSRLSFYLAVVLIIILFILNRKPNFIKKRKVVCFFAIFSFAFSAIFSLTMIFNYDSSDSWMRNLNETLGGRLSLGLHSLSEYPINLFGHNVKYIGNGLDINGKKTIGTYNYVDCLYLNILEKYGIIFVMIFIMLLTYTSYKTWENKNYALLIILSFYALHGIIDDLEIYLFYNTFWFTISEYFISNKLVMKEDLK